MEWQAIRTEDPLSASNWLATVGRLTSAEKIKSETAIEKIVSVVRRPLRNRFLNTSDAYFMPIASLLFRGWIDCGVPAARRRGARCAYSKLRKQ